MKKEFEKERKDNQTEDLFWDMPDMDDDEKFSQWLENEYLKEADAIEESLLSGRRYEDHPEIVQKLSVSRESFYQRAREEGLLEEETDEHVSAENPAMGTEADISKEESICADVCASDKNVSEAKASGAEMPETKVVEFRKKKHGHARLGRIAGIAGVCLLCVFAASMSSEANRKYLVNSVRILSGNDSQLLTDNSNENEKSSSEESDAIADIEEKLGVEVPEFYYRPQGMEFVDYSIKKIAPVAHIKYKYKKNNIYFYIDKQQEETVSNINSLNGSEKVLDKIHVDNMEVVIKKIQDTEDEQMTYVAEWNYKDVAYQLLGKLELEELKKIIKEMKF